MQLFLECTIELTTYQEGRRIVLDVLAVERVRDRLIAELHWRPNIAHLAAVYQFNVQRMPLDESIISAYDSQLITRVAG